MSSRALTLFTDKPDFFSGGVSRMTSIERCDPLQFVADEPAGTDCWVRFPVCAHSDGMEAFFDVCIRGEFGTLALSEAETYRLLCHALVQGLPDAAFAEAVESLSGMYEFYRHESPRPAIQKSPSVEARVTGGYTAPVFSVGEE